MVSKYVPFVKSFHIASDMSARPSKGSHITYLVHPLSTIIASHILFGTEKWGYNKEGGKHFC